MYNNRIIIVVLLFVAACAPRHVRADDQNRDSNCTQQKQSGRDTSRTCLDLPDTLRDKERSQMLLRDRACIHTMLQHPELRHEMLQHSRFMRQMMKIKEMRQELLQNEQMMNEMLRNRGINREINRNREMMEEIEKNQIYRQIDQELHAEILEELLLESTGSEEASIHPAKKLHP